MSRVELGPFVVEASVAAGGFGRVWRGHHQRSGAPVAIKVLHGGRGERARVAFAREIRAVARLDHPAVVPIIDAGSLDSLQAVALDAEVDAPWLCTPWVSGGTLATRTGAEWSLVRRWTTAVLDALAHAHARGVLHLDVKPANVLCSASGAALLTDFGIASLLDEARESGTAGSPGFMAPEQISGGRLVPATDVYAVGCLVWTLLEGHPPFTDPDPIAVARLHLTAPPALPGAWPGPLRVWMQRCLEKRPGDRYAHVLDARRALPTASLVAGEGESPASTPTVVSTFFETAKQASTGDLTELPSPSEVPRVPVLTAAAPAEGAATLRRAAGWLRWTGAGHTLLGQRALPLVGRGLQRESLWAAARRVDEGGTPEVVAIVGPRGSGASHLARWLAWSTAEHGAARALPHLPDGRVDRLTVCWVDEPDAEQVHLALAVAAQRSDPVLLVLAVETERVQAAPDVGRALAAVRRSSRASVVEVGPLPERELARLAQAVIDVDFNLALTLAADADGSPGAMLAAIRRGLSQGVLVSAPDGLRVVGSLTPESTREAAHDALRAHPEAPAVWRAERWLEAGEPARALQLVWPICGRPPVQVFRVRRAWTLALDALQRLGAGPADGRVAMLRALQAVRWAGEGRQDRVAEELRWLDAANQAESRPDLRAWRARVQVRVARLEDPGRARQLCEAALPDAEASGQPLVWGQLLERSLVGAGPDADGVAARALEVFAGAPHAEEWSAVVRTTEAERLLELERAEEALAVLLPALQTTTALATHPMVLGLYGSALLELGRLPEARSALQRGEALLEAQGDFAVLGMRLGLATVDVLAGRPDIEVLQALEAAIRGVFAGPSPYGLEAASALVRACVETGELSLAAQALASVESQLHVRHTRWARRHLLAARRVDAGGLTERLGSALNVH